jgi:hypothetical protein
VDFYYKTWICFQAGTTIRFKLPAASKKNQIMSNVPNLPDLKSRDHIKYSKSLHGQQKLVKKKGG